ncbi:hypothetical protein P12x_004458 [Tundrisphaera lichenicola]|uniref:hypothetical protein n=1 Tax=Tundrisphaera lichenicola TaxID=2029860 RepID=UPI003EB916BD
MIPATPKSRVQEKRPAISYRLELKIGETVYDVESLPNAPDAGGRAFRLTKADGTAYDVAQTAYGPECDCPDYIFRRDGIDPEGCKHVKAVVGSGLILRNPLPDRTRA